MSPEVALLALTALVCASTGIGIALRHRSTRVRRPAGAPRITTGELGITAFGAHATLVQFSTDYCSRCPATGRMARELTDQRPGVTFVDVNVTHRSDLARTHALVQTPTLLLLDSHGSPQVRLAGVITRQALIEALTLVPGDRA